MIDEVKLWVITHKTSDYGERYVLRMHLLTRSGHVIDKNPVAIESTLEDIRKWVLPGMTCVPRDPADDPVIVETWV